MKPIHTSFERIGMAIVALHLIVGVVHSFAHVAMNINMVLWQNAYILLVIVLLPVISGILLWRRRKRGFLLLLVSTLGSLVFGGYYHFIAAGPDNVGELGHHAWAFSFQITATLLAILEAVGALIGLMGLRR